MPKQKEVELEGLEDADSTIASRGLLNLDEDNGRVITNDDLRETQIDDDTSSVPTKARHFFPITAAHDAEYPVQTFAF
jgi:hypothetical protein